MGLGAVESGGYKKVTGQGTGRRLPLAASRLRVGSSPPPASRGRARARALSLSLPLSVSPLLILALGGSPLKADSHPQSQSHRAISRSTDPLRPSSSPHGPGLSSFVSQYTSLLISPGTNYAIISPCIGAKVDIEFINSPRT